MEKFTPKSASKSQVKTKPRVVTPEEQKQIFMSKVSDGIRDKSIEFDDIAFLEQNSPDFNLESNDILVLMKLAYGVASDMAWEDGILSPEELMELNRLSSVIQGTVSKQSQIAEIGFIRNKISALHQHAEPKFSSTPEDQRLKNDFEAKNKAEMQRLEKLRADRFKKMLPKLKPSWTRINGFGND